MAGTLLGVAKSAEIFFTSLAVVASLQCAYGCVSSPAREVSGTEVLAQLSGGDDTLWWELLLIRWTSCRLGASLLLRWLVQPCMAPCTHACLQACMGTGYQSGPTASYWPPSVSAVRAASLTCTCCDVDVGMVMQAGWKETDEDV